jgi:hypothetical protein
MVVEITPPGIEALGWKFYIIWTVFVSTCLPLHPHHPCLCRPLFRHPSLEAVTASYPTDAHILPQNASFVPIVYLFYPETADRTLEDIDRFFRSNHDVLVFRHEDAISSKRPAAYRLHEEDEVRRNSSVDKAVLRKMSKVEPAGLDDERVEETRVENEKV